MSFELFDIEGAFVNKIVTVRYYFLENFGGATPGEMVSSAIGRCRSFTSEGIVVEGTNGSLSFFPMHRVVDVVRSGGRS